MLVEQCAFMYVFLQQPRCALIGACVLIRMNMVFPLWSRDEMIDCDALKIEYSALESNRDSQSQATGLNRMHILCQ